MDVDVESDLLEDDGDEPLDIEEVQEAETERITVFDLGGELYGAPVMSVDEVIKTTPLTRVPRTADAVDGVIDIRGSITVIINPWVHLELPSEPADWADQFVVSFRTEDDQQPVGVRIDRIVGVEPIPVADIDRDDPADAPNADNPLVEGVARRVRDGEVRERIGLLDIDNLITASGRHPHLVTDTDVDIDGLGADD
jgi:purine-binding chemotaxis protein CheW